MTHKWAMLTRCMLLTCMTLFCYSDTISAQKLESFSTAPLNPVFESYLNAKTEKGQQNSGFASHPVGLPPIPINMSHLRSESAAQYFDSSDASLPAYYDLRNYCKLSPVKDLSICSSWWALASVGPFGTNLLSNELLQISENNLSKKPHFDTDPYNNSLNWLMSTAYLTRWSGPVNDSVDSYNASSDYSPEVLPVHKNIQALLLLPGRISSSDNVIIQQAIMQYGAVLSSMYFDENSQYYNDITSSYYYGKSEKEANHAIVIVGWDDNYSRTNFTEQPDKDGAFIARNSWGTNWGQGGYFYISYYDKVLAHDENTVIIDTLISKQYNNIHQYDDLGLTKIGGYDNSTAFFANIFTATTNETLVAVSFYTLSSNTSYVISAYTGVSSSPSSGILTAKTSGVIKVPGYHTVQFPAEVPLPPGEKFSVIIKVTTPGLLHPVPIEAPVSNYSSRATAASGQSYVSVNGSDWYDLTSIEPNANVCLKALTQAATTTTYYLVTPVAGSNGSISRNTVQEVNSGTTTSFAIKPNSGYKTVTPIGGTCPQGTLSGTTYITGAITKDCTVEASFTSNQTYIVTFTAGPHGSISGKKKQAVDYNGNTSPVTAKPATGYYFINWTGSNGFVSTDQALTLQNVTSHQSIKANFAPIKFTLSFAAGPNGSIVGISPQSVNYGARATAVKAVASTGYHFEKWTGNSGFVTTSANPLTLKKVKASQDITANFAINNYTIAFVAGKGGGISGNKKQTVDHGGSTTEVKAIPSAGYSFVKWIGTNGFISTANPLVVGPVSGNLKITAGFVKTKTQVNLSELKKFEEATAPPGSSLCFKLAGTISYGGKSIKLTGTLASAINRPAVHDGQQFNVRQDKLFFTLDSTGESISDVTTSYVTSSGYLNSISNGLLGTVTSQQLLPAIAAAGDRGNYATIQYNDGTTDTVTWKIDDSNGDAVFTFTTTTTDEAKHKIYIEDNSYTIKPDGTITYLATKASFPKDHITLKLSGERYYSFSGKVTTKEGATVSGVAITITQGPISQTSITDSYGEYSINVVPDGTFAVTPSCPIAATFTPSSKMATMNGSDVTGLDFVINGTTSPQANDASYVSDTSASLNGSFSNPFGATITAVYFEYGTTTSYGNTTTPVMPYNNEQSNYYAFLTNMQQLTTYHYRAVLSISGIEFYGADKTFTTLMTPEIIMSGLDYPHSLVVDGSNMYWAEYAAIKTAGKSGGTVTTLVSGLDYAGAGAITVDSTSVYWAETYGYSIKKVGINGGPVTTLASSVGNVETLALGETNVYWPYLGIMTVGKNGGTPTTLVPNQFAFPRELAFYSNSIYWIDNYGGAIMKSDINGEHITTIATNESYARSLNVDSSGVYWIGGDGIKKYSENDGTLTTLSQQGSVGLVLDSTSVYYFSYEDIGGYVLSRVGKNGGAVARLAKLPNPDNFYGLAVDDLNVYWIERPYYGLIKKLPKKYK